jgi:hypothetical protein
VRLVASRAPLLLKHRLECPLHFRLVRPVCLGLPLKPDPQQTRASEVPQERHSGLIQYDSRPDLRECDRQTGHGHHRGHYEAAGSDIARANVRNCLADNTAGAAARPPIADKADNRCADRRRTSQRDVLIALSVRSPDRARRQILA